MSYLRYPLSILLFLFSLAFVVAGRAESSTEPVEAADPQTFQILCEQEWVPWLVWLTDGSPEFEVVPWHSVTNPRDLLCCGIIVLSEVPEGLEERMRLERIQAQGAILVEIEDGRRLPWWARMEKNIGQIARAMSLRWPDRESRFQKQCDVLLNWIRLGKRIEWQRCRDAEKQVFPIGGQIQVGGHLRLWHRVIFLVRFAGVDAKSEGMV